MIEADKTFEKLDYVSMFIHTRSGLPRLLFDAKTEMSMEAKLGKSTIDVFLVQDLRVPILACTHLDVLPILILPYHIIVYAYNLYCVGRSFSQAIEAKSQKAKQKGLI
jgi:hypothetical protein